MHFITNSFPTLKIQISNTIRGAKILILFNLSDVFFEFFCKFWKQTILEKDISEKRPECKVLGYRINFNTLTVCMVQDFHCLNM